MQERSGFCSTKELLSSFLFALRVKKRSGFNLLGLSGLDKLDTGRLDAMKSIAARAGVH